MNEKELEATKYRNGIAVAKWYGYKNLDHLSYQTLFQFLELRGFVCHEGWLWVHKDELAKLEKAKQLAEEDKEFAK